MALNVAAASSVLAARQRKVQKEVNSTEPDVPAGAAAPTSEASTSSKTNESSPKPSETFTFSFL
jgi:hypothetical protein